jgi:pimeloyl-ACP methyl ester carboxylesterase
MHHLIFQLLMVLWIALSFGAGWLTLIAARNFLGLTTLASMPPAIAVTFAVFLALRPLAERLLVIRINNAWPYFRKFGRGQPTCFDRPINTGVARLIAAANASDLDEVVLVGHSGGAPLVLPIVARALERDPDLGRRVPSVVVMTLGSIMAGVALHPRAQWMRDMVRRVANEPSVRWIDCQSRRDVLQFWNFDPVAGIGVEVDPQRCNPLIWQIRFRDVILPERYRRVQMNFFRLHYQFIMASDLKAPYDYFALTCGPFAAIDWAQRGREIAADWPIATVIASTGPS